MKRAMTLMASLGLLAMFVLAIDMPWLLKAEARLDAPYHEVVTGREAETSAVDGNSISTIFEAFAPPAITTPTQTVIPTPRDTTEPQPTSEATLVPVPTHMPSPISQPTSTGALPTTFAPTSTGTREVTPVTGGTATEVLRPTETAIRESATPPLEAPLATPAQATWTAIVTWPTWTATVTSMTTSLATHTAMVGSEPPAFLLDRLVRNKPSIWGHKGYYVLLGIVYLTLVFFFLKQIINPFKRRP
jgi:hypothetical protein